MDQLLEMIAFMARHLEPGNFCAAVKCVLIQLHIPTDSKGYRCLILAIPIYHSDPGQSWTKEIYPEVARLTDCVSWKAVERSIRMAISCAWGLRDPTIWACYFQRKRKPSNGEFISKISEMLDVWMACAQTYDKSKV